MQGTIISKIIESKSYIDYISEECNRLVFIFAADLSQETRRDVNGSNSSVVSGSGAKSSLPWQITILFVMVLILVFYLIKRFSFCGECVKYNGSYEPHPDVEAVFDDEQGALNQLR